MTRRELAEVTREVSRAARACSEGAKVHCRVSPLSLYLAGQVVELLAGTATETSMARVKTARGCVWELPKDWLSLC